MFNIVDMRSAWKVDSVIRRDRPFSHEEMTRRTEQEILCVVVPTASAEDTIIAKLEWSKQGASERQLRDVVGILRVRGNSLDLAYVEQWVNALGLEQQWERARAMTTSDSVEQ